MTPAPSGQQSEPESPPPTPESQSGSDISTGNTLELDSNRLYDTLSRGFYGDKTVTIYQ